jgi:hypothetical protein
MVQAPNHFRLCYVNMSMLKRISLSLALGILFLGLVSFDVGAASPQKGVVEGKAVPCSGPMRIPTAHLAVFKGRALIASGRFPTGSTFHFALSPGRYTITDNAAYPTGTPFRVRARHLTHVVVVDSCE